MSVRAVLELGPHRILHDVIIVSTLGGRQRELHRVRLRLLVGPQRELSGASVLFLLVRQGRLDRVRVDLGFGTEGLLHTVRVDSDTETVRLRFVLGPQDELENVIVELVLQQPGHYVAATDLIPVPSNIFTLRSDLSRNIGHKTKLQYKYHLLHLQLYYMLSLMQRKSFCLTVAMTTLISSHYR